MAELEYPQFIFEKHDPNKFYKYQEIQNHQGFILPNEQNKTLYLLDQDGGWCDLNGCYYNSQGQPSGWIVLSKDGKKYMKFNMNADFLTEQSNIYYSNQTIKASISEQYQQLYNNNNKEQLNENQQPNIENIKQQQNKDDKKKQKEYRGKQIEGQIDKIGVISEQGKENQIRKDQYNEKIDNQEEPIKKYRDRKRNANNKKDNQKNNEIKKYYILNIQENTLNKEDLVKYLIEEYKIKKEFIIEFNENILKLVQEKDAIKLYRVNKKEQTDKVQKFIVSI